MTDVVFPPMSAERPGATGVVSAWYVRDGDRVEADQVLAEVQVDKVAADVVSPVAGTIHLTVPVDAEVQQGIVIATVG